MSKQFLNFNNVSFGYENSASDIFSKISFKITTGWVGITGANGSGKTTLLKLSCGLLVHHMGNIERPTNSYYNEQRTDIAPFAFGELLNSFDKYSFQLTKTLRIEPGWINRWNTLSHGERKRVQIACALWKHPDLLAIDEPTNHLDAQTKEMVVNSLKSYKGIGLIVSHDRELLENLCEQFLFIDPPNIDYRRSKLSEAINLRKSENEFAIKQLEIKQTEINKLEQEYKRRSALVERSKRKSSKKNIDKKDRDAKAKIDFGRLTGKDAVGGSLKTQMFGRIEKTKAEMNTIIVKREYQTGISLSNSVSKRNYLLNLQPGSLNLAEDKELFYEKLIIGTRDRIAITGANGSGKSTLTRYILEHLNAEPENTTYIPQEISVDETKKLMVEIKKLSNDHLGKLMIIISRLGSDAKRVLATDIPSPGETRKLLLGLGIAKNPHIIIMDEPTNHMDVASIECLEDALKKVSCSLLLVSHDKQFLHNLTTREWKIVKDINAFRVTSC